MVFDLAARRRRRPRSVPHYTESVKAPDGTIRLAGAPVLDCDERAMGRREAEALVREGVIGGVRD